MVLTRSRRFSEVESNFDISSSDLRALVAATSKRCAIVQDLKKKLPSISFRPNASLNIWREQIFSILPAELRPVSLPARYTPAFTVASLQLADTNEPAASVDAAVPDASILSQNRDFEEPAGTESELEHEGALQEARETISMLRSKIFQLEEQLRQREMTQQQISQPEEIFEQDFENPSSCPPLCSYDNLSILITGLPQCSLTRHKVGAAVVQEFRETLHLQPIPSFKVVKVFRHARPTNGQSVGALIRVRSDAEVAAIFAAKRHYLTASSPISIDRNRSKQQRTARSNTRAEHRSECSAGSREAAPTQDTGTSASSLNPHAAIFVPASMSQAPNVCSAPMIVTGEDER